MSMWRGWAMAGGMVALAAGTVGCERRAANDRAAPESAWRAFRDALGSRDRDAVWAFLGDETRAALEAQAATFGEGGPAAKELIRVSWVPAETDVASIRRENEDDAGVDLVLTSVHGVESRVRMLRGEAGWRVELRGLGERE